MPSHLMLINSGNLLNWNYLEQSAEVWRIGCAEPQRHLVEMGSHPGCFSCDNYLVVSVLKFR